MPSYVFDTSVWIHIGRHHPSDIFAVTIWANLDNLIDAGDLRSPEEVLHELQNGYDSLASELKGRSGLFVPLTPDVQAATNEVMAQCPTLSDQEGDRNRADPFVVALARTSDGAVVTGEKPRKAATGRMKIPDACNHFKIRYIDWFAFLREQRWRL